MWEERNYNTYSGQIPLYERIRCLYRVGLIERVAPRKIYNVKQTDKKIFKNLRDRLHSPKFMLREYVSFIIEKHFFRNACFI